MFYTGAQWTRNVKQIKLKQKHNKIIKTKQQQQQHQHKLQLDERESSQKHQQCQNISNNKCVECTINMRGCLWWFVCLCELCTLSDVFHIPFPISNLVWVGLRGDRVNQLNLSSTFLSIVSAHIFYLSLDHINNSIYIAWEDTQDDDDAVTF